MNIISACNSIEILNEMEIDIDIKKINKNFKFSVEEAQTLSKLIQEFKRKEATPTCFNGFYISYSIPQISKEFDMLRFSDDLVINIELKGPLDDEIKVKKITEQMTQNYYYLKFLSKNILIFTYVEDDGIYQFDETTFQPQKVELTKLLENLEIQQVNFNINLDDIFIPSNYLISPFNNTLEFLKQEYFLTDHQQNIKQEIMKCLQKNEYNIYCISANAGTGKTLLVYDIAKRLIDNGNSPLIIHCGKHNSGHYELISLGWNVVSIRDINKLSVNDNYGINFNVFVIDEAQRISLFQLGIILEKSIELKIPIIFSYDIKQYLRTNESTEIYEYITKTYKIHAKQFTLTNKIRTNKEMASFIQNLVKIGSSNSFLNYENITIEFIKTKSDVIKYVKSLENNDCWKAITFTNSIHRPEPIDSLSGICETNAHDVIGQEFRKVVLVLDSNFRYDGQGKLEVRTNNYYNAFGMLYQILTRVIDELKIIVLDNEDLFVNLLRIKYNLF
jgi:hypothetical protein